MPIKSKNLIIATHRKLDTKPKYLTENSLARNSLRACAYQFNTLPKVLTESEETKRFAKHLKRYIKDPKVLPKPKNQALYTSTGCARASFFPMIDNINND